MVCNVIEQRKYFLVKSEVILEKDGGLLERIAALVCIACGKCTFVVV